MAIMDMCRALRLRRKEDAVESADINERLGIQFKGLHSLQDCTDHAKCTANKKAAVSAAL